MTTATSTVLVPGEKYLVKWSGLTTAGNSAVTAYDAPKPFVAASVQVTGTFGSATAVLLGSNDGTNFVQVYDVFGSAVLFAAAGAMEISSAFRFYKPSLSGGTGDDIGVTILHWA